MSDEIAAEIEDVRARLGAARKARMAAQRRAAEHTTVTTALERASRDRSALSSPEIEVERERVQRLHDELVECCGSVDRTRVLLIRVKASGMYADTIRLDKILAEEAADRARRSAATRPGVSRG